MADELQQEVYRLTRQVRDQANTLGGGWRLEQGGIPVVVLTTVEAERLIKRLQAASQMGYFVGEFIEHITPVMKEQSRN